MNGGIKCAPDTGSGARSTWGQACGAAAQNTTASHPACRRPLAGSTHLPACNQSISPTGDGPRALNGASDVRSAGLPECQGTD